MHEHPKMLYRDGSAFEWEGRSLECVIVCDHAGEAEARKVGWRDALELLGTVKGPDPLDHDSDGSRGGSLKGEASTAAKGAAKKRAAKA